MFLLFSNMVVEIEWTFVTWHWRFRMRAMLFPQTYPKVCCNFEYFIALNWFFEKYFNAALKVKSNLKLNYIKYKIKLN